MTLVHHRFGFPSVDSSSGYPEKDRWKPLSFFWQGPFAVDEAAAGSQRP
jgi:hypothetical protein